MKKLMVFLLVFAVLAPGSMAFCHCCQAAPADFSATVLSSQPHCCCGEQLKNADKDCAPRVEKAKEFFQPLGQLLPGFFSQAPEDRAEVSKKDFSPGPPPGILNPDTPPIYLSLSTFRI